MVKKFAVIGILGLFILVGVISGCNKSSTPIIPASSASILTLTIPSKVLSSKPHSPAAASTKKASTSNALPDTGMGRLEYYIVADGITPITGAINYASGSQVGIITIPLPKDGRYIVSAEWFYLYNPGLGSAKPVSGVKDATIASPYVAQPEFAGADAVTVQGTTSLVLDMEDIGYSEYSCYLPNLTDSSNYDYALGGGWDDLYNFDSGVYNYSTAAASITGVVGDIQASFDKNTLSTYFTGPFPAGATPVSIYAYLGNGDFVNFPVLPSNAVFYADTISAKSAITGQPGSMLVANDIFVVKIPSTNGMAWVQFKAPNISDPPLNNSALESFIFIYNQGFNYMKFQETTYGHNNCNISGG